MDNATNPEPHPTAEQQETLESGLQMLARMVARAHLRRQAALGTVGTSPDPADDPGGTDDPAPS